MNDDAFRNLQRLAEDHKNRAARLRFDGEKGEGKSSCPGVELYNRLENRVHSLGADDSITAPLRVLSADLHEFIWRYGTQMFIATKLGMVTYDLKHHQLFEDIYEVTLEKKGVIRR